jgi:secreted protein with Ig-like and vWFA domain
VPSSAVPKPQRSLLRFATLAATVVFGVGVGAFLLKNIDDRKASTVTQAVPPTAKPLGELEELKQQQAAAGDFAKSIDLATTDKGLPADLPLDQAKQAKGDDGKMAKAEAAKPAPSIRTPSPEPTVEMPAIVAGRGGSGFGGNSGGGVPGSPPAGLVAPPGAGPVKPAGGGIGGPAEPKAMPGSGLRPSSGQPASDGIAMGRPALRDKPGDFYFEREKGKGDRESYRKQTELTGNDRFVDSIENPFVTVDRQTARSTFGVDVDTASYSIVRKMLHDGVVPPPGAIRLEEMVNYFPYQDKGPDGDDPYRVSVELAECPWQPRHTLARIALKAKPIERDKRPPSNLVFLIDVSGSMDEPNKLPWVKQSLTMLVDQLGENDRVSMVVYAGASGLVLDSTSAVNKNVVLTALDKLRAGGSTNGAGGIQQAYGIAEKNFIKNGTNRVVLCTDGDWNVGTTSTDDLVKLIEEKRKSNVFLSVLGFGMGNLRDEMMVKLANKGNGNYAYIDSLNEARKVLVEQIAGTLVTVAKDVKLQIEFNPAVVKQYRLLGYEKRILAARDFADDTKDAGEMGAGHVVTAFYELVPANLPADPGDEPLKYQPNPKPAKVEAAVGATELMTLKLRHKKPTGTTSVERELPIANERKALAAASEDFRFGAAVAMAALSLRDSAHKGESTLARAIELALTAKEYDPNGYRGEFVDLLRRARQVTGKP